MKKKKKKKIKKGIVLLITILFISLFGVIIYFGFGNKIKNIYVVGNNLLSDQELIELGGLEDYPNFYTTASSKIRKKIKKNLYIKDVKIKKGFLSIYIYVTEYEPLFIRDDNKTIVFENKKEVSYNDENLDIPILINYVPDTKYDILVSEYLKINDEILKKVSEIKYDPNEYDEDRFLLYMNDNNYVYVTLTKFDLLNKYNDLVKKLDGKKGILYLDSGNYFEIKS